MPTRVLIVEDEDPVRELLAETSFDLLVTDLKLPDGDGMDLVRAAAARPVPPVSVVMSGYATVEDAIAVLTVGAADFILKPFRLRDAHTSLQRALARGAEERQRRVADVALSWIEAATAAQSEAEAEALLQALQTLAAAWAPGTVIESADGPVAGWLAVGRRSVRVVPPEPRIERWIRTLDRALGSARG